MSDSDESIVIEDKLRSYIFKQYPALQTQGLGSEQPLTGVLDSLAVLGVVGFIEPEFLVELSPSDLTDENFETLGSIARLVERLKATVK
jgi:acyl carrier protein